MSRDDKGGVTSGTGASCILSVVIVRFAGGEVIAATLEALAPQTARTEGEILVAHRANEPPSPAMRTRHPAVRWIAGDADASPARLRALAVLASTGTIVACTEDHCVPAPDWCEQLLAAQKRESGVIGGAIDKGSSTDGAAWAAYLLDYARYTSPLPAGTADYASDCNVSYPRAALDTITARWRDEFHETTVNWALRANGLTLRLEPSIKVSQDRPIRLDHYLAEREEHGRTFARTRIDAGASLPARLRYVLTALVLAPVIVRRVKGIVASRGVMSAVPAAAWSPLERAARAWARGELRGYLGR